MQLDFSVVELLKALVGVPALIALVVNVLKWFTVIKPGKATQWAKILNVVVFALLYVLATFYPDIDILYFDEIARTVAGFGLAMIGFMPAGAVISGKVHDGIRGVPILGKSNS